MPGSVALADEEAGVADEEAGRGGESAPAAWSNAFAAAPVITVKFD
jgi:hypothetical protein